MFGEIDTVSELISLAIPAVKRLQPRRFKDDRGWFSETFRTNWFAPLGLEFIQENHSLSVHKGTLRGLHFQTGPSTQAKLVRCVAGRVLDVAIDIRHGSPSFGHYITEELSAENGVLLLIPHGFAHGFLTLSDHCEIVYKVDRHYDRQRDKGMAYNDPEIAIRWPDNVWPEDDPVLSDKDKLTPYLSELPEYFSYDPNNPDGAICHDLNVGVSS
jgi:dTDP-4-dehydrorhamnose 3,5-epimerase